MAASIAWMRLRSCGAASSARAGAAGRGAAAGAGCGLGERSASLPSAHETSDANHVGLYFRKWLDMPGDAARRACRARKNERRSKQA